MFTIISAFVKTYARELFQVGILGLAVILFYYLSAPQAVRVETKVVTEVKEVLVYVDRVVIKEVEKVVYRDKTTTRTVNKPNGTTITTIVVDRGTTEVIEKELESEERVEFTKALTQVAEYRYEGGKTSRWSLGLVYNLQTVNKFIKENVGLEGGFRVADSPLWLTLGAARLGREYRAGFRLEF